MATVFHVCNDLTYDLPSFSSNFEDQPPSYPLTHTSSSSLPAAVDSYSYQTDYLATVVVFLLPTNEVQNYVTQVIGPDYTVRPAAKSGDAATKTSVAVVIGEHWTDIENPNAAPRFRNNGHNFGEIFPLSIEVVDSQGVASYVNISGAAKVRDAATKSNDASGVVVTTESAKEAGKRLGVAKVVWDNDSFRFDARRGLFSASVFAHAQNRTLPHDPVDPQSWLQSWGFASPGQAAPAPDTVSNQWFTVNWRGLTLPILFPKSQNYLNLDDNGRLTSLQSVSERRWGRLGLWSGNDDFAFTSSDPTVKKWFENTEPSYVILRRGHDTISGRATPVVSDTGAQFTGCQ